MNLSKRLLESYVKTEIRKNAGIITLNRPKQLNALNLSMINEINSTLKHWVKEKSVKQVIFKSSSSKAFGAGGDI